MAARLEYNNIIVEFGENRDFNSYLDSEFVMVSQVQSMSGVEQTLKFFDQQKIRATMRLVTAQKKQELDEWFDFVKDGTAFKFWRDWNLGTYIGFEGKSLKTNDGDVGTFAITEVTDAAYYLDPSTGLLTTVGTTGNDTNTPRFPAGQYGGGVLIEGARTNLITHPSVFDNTTSGGAWINSNCTVGDNTTETLDPAGANASDKLTATSNAGGVQFSTSTSISTNDGVASVWLKSPSGDVSVTLKIESTSAGVLTSTGSVNISAGDSWTNLSVVHESSGSVAGNWRMTLTIDTNTEIIYAWDAQLEVGSDVLFPSQAIGAVSTSSITRNAESLEYSTTDVFNQDKITVSFWVKPEWVFDEHPTAALFWVNSTVASNRVLSYHILSSGAHEIRHYNGDNSVGAQILGSASGDFTQNSWTHVVITADSTISNGLLRYIDGVLDGTSSNSAFSPADVESLFAIGSAVGGASPAFCVFDDFEIWKDVKDASWVNNRFNQNRGSGYGRNRFDNMLLDLYKTTERPNGFFEIELVMREQLS